LGTVYWYLANRDIPKTTQDSTKENIKTEKYLVELGENRILMTPNSIGINMGYESPNPNELLIDPTNYPKLFGPKDEFAQIHTKEISEGVDSDIKLIYISRQVPSHGDIADLYYLVVDPKIGKVVDSGYQQYYGGDLHFNNICTNCNLPTLRFREYDRQQQKFVLTNNKHRDEFVELLKKYKEYEDKEYCRINGKNIPVSEVINTASDDTKCSDIGEITNKPTESFLSVGEYKQIISNIKQIIDGKNIEMYDQKNIDFGTL